MNLTENALKVLKARYLLKDERGKVIETPEGMFRRVARTIAAAESQYGGNAAEWEEKFYELMTSLKFLPNSPTLMNAGKKIGQLAACFVLPVDDSMHSIFDTLKNAALILQSGGGTGFSFTHLRPKSDVVHSTGGIASGPVSFMKIYNTATDVIKQGGARRGANMGILRIDHPDILDFIRIKRTEGELTNFNISVSVTDAFMDTLKNEGEYELINPRSNAVVGKIKAHDVFKEIVESAWETGDPGLIFIDRINRDNPTPNIGSIESTNPCGEHLRGMHIGVAEPFKVCKTANSSQFTVKDIEKQIDFDKLAEDIKTAVRFLDNSIDVNKYPLPAIDAMHKGNRKIGLGVMGWADVLILLELPYNHKKAFELGEMVMKFMQDESRNASAELAHERGVFSNFKGSIYDAPDRPRVRNATTTTIAPTELCP